ncbi:MAG: hypothetical protein DCF23_00500 [Cyanobium sp.]|nr:MAG: hypothetical protein DCF23_00500 [Cyanobium sp.]
MGADLGAALGAAAFSTGARGLDRRAGLSLPYLVFRGASQQPYYKRRLPPEVREATGCSTITVRLELPLGSRGFHASYSRAHSEAEHRISGARQRRQLSPQEQLGVAGRWAMKAPTQGGETTPQEAAAAVLWAIEQLGVTLPIPLPVGWMLPPVETAGLGAVVQLMARRIDQLSHPSVWWQPAALVHGEEPSARVAHAHLQEVIDTFHEGINHWLLEAQQQLRDLGVVVPLKEVQAVALRLASTAVVLGRQTAALEAGELPPPLPAFPPPPQPSASEGDGGPTFALALERWKTVRQPSTKTRLDAAARLQELAAHIGHDRLDRLSGEEVTAWRGELLRSRNPATCKRKLALVRAVLAAAAADGMAVQREVLDRLSGRGLRPPSGTTRQRRPFSEAEAQLLWRISREQQGRPLDRWGFPLGLAIGARLEELAGLRRCDIRQAAGLWMVEIQPTVDRRLKNDASARVVPLPAALVAEGFTGWVEGMPDGLLFEEPRPPGADPRLSHYASIRLGRILRERAGIEDPTAVFHSCRHFAAQQLVDGGAEQRAIEQILGHESKTMTARYSRGGMPLALLAAAMKKRAWGWVPPVE